MSQTKLTQLQKVAQRNKSTLELIHKHTSHKSQLAARQVYNKESRNIAKFIREQKLLQKKVVQQPKMFSKQQKLQKRTRFGVTLRYEDNQTLQMQFEDNNKFLQKKEPNTIGYGGQSKSSQIQSKSFSKYKQPGDSRYDKFNLFSAFKESSSKRFKNPHRIQINVIDHCNSNRSNRSPEPKIQKKTSMRRRVVTQFDLNFKHEQPGSTDNKVSQSFSGGSAPLIMVTRQKMERFIRNLHRVAWMANYLNGRGQEAESDQEYRQHMKLFQLDIDAAIPQFNLNYMVARRYQLLNFHLEDHYERKLKELEQHDNSIKRQKLIQTDQYTMLDSLSKQSILSMIHTKVSPPPKGKKSNLNEVVPEKQEKVNFSLPYASFVSESETKTSIYRLVAMKTVSFLRIAFSLYDKNKNGKIDEDDLLQMVSLSRKMPQLEPDLLAMGAYMIPNSRFSRSKRRSSRVQPSINQSQSGSYILSPHKIQNQDSEEQGLPEAKSSKPFSLNRYYTFLKEKEQGIRFITSGKTALSLTFPNFCKLFKGKMPAIIYDLYHFLFGAYREDFVQKDKIPLTLSKDTHKRRFKTDHVDQTLQEKWNNRLKNTERILHNLLLSSQRY